MICATPVSGGMGMSLLQKMGWKPGEGLGKNHEGALEPLKLPVKTDKKGELSISIQARFLVLNIFTDILRLGSLGPGS